MKIRSILKITGFTALMVAVLFSWGAVPVQAESGARKGLPLEMLITADELRQLQLSGKSFLLLDARSAKHYNGGHIEGAILPPKADQELADMLSRYPKNTPIVAYCMENCQASAALVMKIKRLGFRDLRDMEEGIEVWEKKGYPVVR